ncbi:MAG TPA: cytochrome c-type biogenesis protein CcmH [Candidatus Angelobacter sp.]|nr:cytochrome c-type biogenesis protein CcmH [Candidatus Angelobacter sp.]
MTRRGPLVTVAALLAVALLAVWITPAGAQQTDRAKQIGGKLVCGVGTSMCNCRQILTQCNHVGCMNSSAMLKTLDQKVAKGDSEEAILQAFIIEYGREVLAEPPKSGFSLIAWLMPSFYLLGGAALVVLVISRWRKRPAAEAAGTSAAASQLSPEFLERARAEAARETED